MMAKRISFDICPDEQARRIAHILGPACAMALALGDLERRRARGEDAVIILSGQTILVGPRPAQEAGVEK